MILLLIYQILILIEVLFDGKFGDDHKLLSNISLTLTIVAAVLLGFVFNIPLGGLAYLFIRLATFDLLFGKIFRKDWFYLGKTSITDQIFSDANKDLLLIIRIYCYIEAFLIVFFA